MSLRPSGCGGRSDAVPPHVEKRRRLRTPSSFIMGTAGAPSACGRKGRRGGGLVRKLKGRRTRGVGKKSDLSHAASEPSAINQPTRTHTHTQSSSDTRHWTSAVCCSPLRFLQPTAPFLPHTLSLSAVWVCMKAAACEYLITNKPSPSYSLSSGWVGELHLSLEIALVLHVIFLFCQSPAAFLIHDFRFKGTLHSFSATFQIWNI